VRVLVTGGAGFVGSAVVRRLLARPDTQVAVYDCITYAASRDTLSPFQNEARFQNFEWDIRSAEHVARAFALVEPDLVIHLAAESHVDRSLEDPDSFVQTNVVGTHVLLNAALDYWRHNRREKPGSFRFHHVSTDEVFGSLGPEGSFREDSRYDPHSPYSASKAASDHFVRAYHHSFGLPVLITNCSNNYGPFQFPEKFVPLMILQALSLQTMPVYGDGTNVRDWIHVDDHAEAILLAARRGTLGSTYNIGGGAELANIEVARRIARLVDEMSPAAAGRPDLISFVSDRPGHDLRYAVDTTRIREELGWKPGFSFEEGLRETVRWYLDNRSWWEPIVTLKKALSRRGIS
jgi:dTDP-glucose 4,6-dehydratase